MTIKVARSRTLLAGLLSLCLLCLGGMPAHAACAGASTPDCGSTPTPAFDTSGQLWLAYVDGGHVWLTRSDDLGASFETARQVNHEPEEIWADGENRPMLAFGTGGEVFVAWTRRNGAPYGGDIRFARSADGGLSFEAPRTVNDDGLLTSHRFVSMAASPSGALYLAWLDKRDQVAAQAGDRPYVGAALYYTVSTDGGRSFAVNRKVADHSCECCRVALAADGDAGMRVLWRHVFEAGTVRDHAISTLLPEGAATVQRATWDDWRLEGCPHHGPALTEGEGGHHLAWFSNGEQGRGVLYGFFDAASGQTRHTRILDARPNGGHPAIAARGEALSLVWLSFDGVGMNVRLAQSADRGRHWREARVLATSAGAADHPVLLWRGDELFLSWHTALEGYRLLPVPAPEKQAARSPAPAMTEPATPMPAKPGHDGQGHQR